MDVLVLWKNGSKNAVCSSELKNTGANKKIEIGNEVKMFYKKKWYRGKVIDVEDPPENAQENDSSAENIPLAKLPKKNAMECDSSDDDITLGMLARKYRVQSNKLDDDFKKGSAQTHQQVLDEDIKDIPDNFSKNEENIDIENNSLSDFLGDISDREDPIYKQTCEAPYCKREVFAACHICLRLLCYEHFQEYVDSCESHSKNDKKKRHKRHRPNDVEKKSNSATTLCCEPEHFVQEGEGKENEGVTKKLKINKHKVAKKLRDFGEEYVSPKTKALVPAKVLQQRCNSELCKKQSRQCLLFNEEQRMEIFTSFMQLGDLTRQREFITRHIKIAETAQKTTKKEESRRQKSHKYYLTIEGNQYLVCKTLFLHTLGISERTMRTSLEKLNSNGIIEGEKRGGRQSNKVITRDKALRDAIHKHIQRFPKVESHYCRSSSTKEYLHPGLTVSKMYSMFIEELNSTDDKPSIDLYRKLFRSLNLSFHRPKKDQCSLCMSYRQGEEDVEEKLKDRYEKHCDEKNKIREIKSCIKDKALQGNSEIACASFDLQQVIYLPQSRESALFYKRRLGNYNFTVYDIASKECHCFLWSELESKRGASEISSCVFKVLQSYDSKKHIKSVALFSDGCSGQNKNSIIATMLLYAVAKTSNIEEISLYFFESFHGQNEGDSAHSAISTALSTAGDIFIPAQLYPVIRLARRKQPYIVHDLQHNDFQDFKKMSKELRILSIRTSGTGEPIKWTDFMEIKVKKHEPLTIFYKTSHLQHEYRSFRLKRQKLNPKDISLDDLNAGPRKITKEKYKDLKPLCEGDTPLIRIKEYQTFYLNLLHE